MKKEYTLEDFEKFCKEFENTPYQDPILLIPKGSEFEKEWEKAIGQLIDQHKKDNPIDPTRPYKTYFDEGKLKTVNIDPDFTKFLKGNPNAKLI